MLPSHLEKYAEKIPVLHGQGFVRLVDVLGDDGSVVTAARVTTGKGRSQHEWKNVPGDCFRVCAVCKMQIGVMDTPPHFCIEGDRRLIQYMMRHRHSSPFEFAEAVFHVRVPMDLWRQWIRHRTANVQEYSTRYSEAIDAALVTPPDKWRAQSGSNRQGSAGTVTEWPEKWGVSTDRNGNIEVRDFSKDAGGRWKWASPDGADPGRYLSAREADVHGFAREVYEERIAFGVAKEQARKDLPLANFTEAYWKCDLHNLLHFLGLRMDAHAQLEIREYANVIGGIVQAWCPLSYEAWEDHRFKAVTFSRQEIEGVRRMLRDYADRLVVDVEGGLKLDPARFLPGGASKRECEEFVVKLGLGKTS